MHESYEEVENKYREFFTIVGQATNQWTTFESQLAQIFGEVCNSNWSAIGAVALVKVSSGPLQFQLVEAALNAKFKDAEYASVHKTWKTTKKSLESFLKVRNDLSHIVVVQSPQEDGSWEFEMLPSLYETNDDVLKKYRAKFQGKPSDFKMDRLLAEASNKASVALNDLEREVRTLGKEVEEARMARLTQLRIEEDDLG